MKSIFEYTNYRQFLRDYYDWAKKNIRGFSHRYFLQKAGMSGPNYLKKVMEGVHSLTQSSIEKFAFALGLSESEKVYFEHLVFFNQAKSLDEKDKYFEMLMNLKTPYNQHQLSKSQLQYYQNWYNIALREILGYFNYKNNPEELGKEVSPPISKSKVLKALTLLEELKLIEKKLDGDYIQTSHSISTGPDIQSYLVPKFHLEMGKLALESITRYKKEDRYFSSLSMNLSRKSYQEIIHEIREFRKKIAEKVAQDPNPDSAYHLNFQLFPLSKPKKGKKKHG